MCSPPQNNLGPASPYRREDYIRKAGGSIHNHLLTTETPALLCTVSHRLIWEPISLLPIRLTPYLGPSTTAGNHIQDCI